MFLKVYTYYKYNVYCIYYIGRQNQCTTQVYHNLNKIHIINATLLKLSQISKYTLQDTIW